jgi:3-mercaptopyruvate sulfurtransferase SseA
MGCSIANILEEQTPVFRIREEEPLQKKTSDGLVVNITKTLSQVKVQHENKELLIKRTTKKSEHSCPPFCIQPMNIDNVKSVGELEVLEFIKVLKKKKSKLLIDARSNTLYRIHTIPGAINIPFTMLKDGNRYQKKVLTLLGAKQHSNQWDFSKVPTLLIFGNSDEESQANQAIRSLLKLSYPANKILYYRGGLSSWKRLGLTLY